MSDDQPRFLANVRLHPGRPDRSILVAALERMLSHREPVIAFTRLESGARLPPDHPAQAIVDAWEGAGPGTPVGVVAEGRGNTLVIATKDRVGDLQGVLDISWTFDPGLTEGFVELLVDLSELLSSPLSVLSHEGGGPERRGWLTREHLHLMAVRETADPDKIVQYGLFRGLAGVAHRMVLGDDLVALLGQDRLAALPSELAHRRGDRWVLTPTAEPLEWTAEEWCPGEAAVIEGLGPEHFFDPVSKALPKVVPELPKVAPYPCRTWDPTAKEWVEHNR